MDGSKDKAEIFLFLAGLAKFTKTALKLWSATSKQITLIFYFPFQGLFSLR